MNRTVQEKERTSFPERLCAWAVDGRRACYLVALVLMAFCCLSGEWATIGDNPAAYLPADTETRRAFTVLQTEFDALGSGRVLLDNISAAQAREVAERLTLAPGVQSVDFDEQEDYQTGLALLSVTFRTPDTRQAWEAVRAALDNFDFTVIDDADASASPVLNGAFRLAVAAGLTLLLVALSRLLRSPFVTGLSVLTLTFSAAFLLDSGTWFLFGELPLSAAVAATLTQCALCAAVVPLFRRTLRERAHADTREAVVKAWTRTAPAIFGAGAAVLFAALSMVLLRTRTGVYPGLVLCKAAATALLTLCVLTPGLLFSLCDALDRTPLRGRDGSPLGAFAVGMRVVMPVVFLAALIASAAYVYLTPAAFDENALPLWRTWGAANSVQTRFGAPHELSVLVPSGDPSRESALLEELSGLPEVRAARGLANMEAMGGSTLGERLTPRHFAELMDLDIDAAEQLYSAYVQQTGDYAQLSAGLDDATLPLGQMFLFTCDRAREGYVTLDWGRDNELTLLYKQMEAAVRELQGAEHSRLILRLSIPEENADAFLRTLRGVVGRYYPEGALLWGDAVRAADLSETFRRDAALFAALTALVALAALFCATGSIGVAVVSTLTAVGGAWLTFALWNLCGQRLYFLSELITGAVVTAFGVLLAVVLAGRWSERQRDTLSQALSDETLTLTLCAAVTALTAFAVGALCGDRGASSVALCVGVGAAVSLGLSLFVLPPALALFAAPMPTGPRPSHLNQAVKPKASAKSEPVPPPTTVAATEAASEEKKPDATKPKKSDAAKKKKSGAEEPKKPDAEEEKKPAEKSDAEEPKKPGATEPVSLNKPTDTDAANNQEQEKEGRVDEAR